MKNNEFNFGSDLLTIGILLQLIEGTAIGVINNEIRQKITKSRQNVDDIVESGKTVYGINTGFGPLCTTIISSEQTKELQYNLLRSHSVGVGDSVPLDVAKSMMLLKIQALCKGYSGISIEVLERILWHVEKGFIPMVPNQGSVGASGDLAPLAHLFLPLIGLGKVWSGSAFIDTKEVLNKEGLTPLELRAKEGLALINGTQFIAAYAVRALDRMKNCLDIADIIGAMSLEALMGSVKPFDEELHNIRPFKGSQYVAKRLKKLLNGSEILTSHINCDRVQDPYSLRCMPQVHGASRNAWLHLKELTEIEINSVTDNPIIINKEKTISGGNFHGQLLALPLDYAAFAASEIGNISDRRTYLLLGGEAELPVLLMKNTGINSGFMIPQYTSAALVTENKTLCYPASADSVPTSLGQEDHVSMGSISGRKVNQIIDNLEKILAVELITAAQAFDFRRPLKSGPILEACHQLVREHIDHASEDRIFSEDIETARQLIIQRSLTSKADEFQNKPEDEFSLN